MKVIYLSLIGDLPDVKNKWDINVSEIDLYMKPNSMYNLITSHLLFYCHTII